ncbi:hypothetical protein BU23DRAFT_562243 [Bimuria novae-zelandiae CBS 107.79]|uniref:Uncharacterized protein n=1 Tax=Bimuria novae-zelandiae CBS 107.79 TaxID=1447943 RepID=A0A6A5UGM8_9PLEO|nr:hypothetical protein BU23DRAFT_562243 [Bimuria novae-zelandiae CBS 107.79]
MRPINKFGNNHFNIKDDWYNGYFIPKESILMANWWHIQYSPEYYPENPERFLPERWINYPHSAAKAVALPDGTQRDHLTYGGSAANEQNVRSEQSIRTAFSGVLDRTNEQAW